MHYGKSYFGTVKGKPTMSAKMPGIKLGQRRALSKTDCLKVTIKKKFIIRFNNLKKG